jgi:dihydroorotase
MRSLNRRQLVAGIGAAFAAGSAGFAARAAMGPNDKFDLVIKGGEVLDPSQRLRAKRDIGMRFGKIEALEADIPAARANRVLNAAGRVVVPGLIDLHSHVFTTNIGIPADELVPYLARSQRTPTSRSGSRCACRKT